MRDWRRRYDYGVSRQEVEAFVQDNKCVQRFLKKCAESTKYNFQTSKFKETRSVKKLQEEGLIIEK